MSNVIDITDRLTRISANGKVTLIVPLSNTTPDFDERLYDAMTELLGAWSLAISSTNFPNEAGEQIVMYSIDVTEMR